MPCKFHPASKSRLIIDELFRDGCRATAVIVSASIVTPRSLERRLADSGCENECMVGAFNMVDQALENFDGGFDLSRWATFWL